MSPMMVVAKREFLERVRTKWFLIVTLLGPLMMIGLIVIPALAATQGTSGTKIQVADRTGGLVAPITEAMKKVEWEVESIPVDTAEKELQDRIGARTINGYLLIPADALDGGTITYRGDNASSQIAQIVINQTVTTEVLKARGKRMGLDGNQIQALFAEVKIDSKLNTGKESSASGLGSFFVGYILAFILYMVITLYCVNVMRSVVQEKTTRVMEFMVAAVKPRDLLGGKVLGVGAAGLLQVSIWLVMAGFMLANKSTVLGWFGMHGGGPELPSLGADAIVVVLVYFVLGFFFYASVFAALGALVSSEQETQQVQMPVTLILVVGMLCLNVISNDPRGGTAQLMTMIPLWAPMLMPMRYVLGGASLTDVAISMAILVASTLVVVRAAAKIYRVGVLMYGKRPGFGEVIRWLRH